MSYESKMFEELALPSREKVIKILVSNILKRGGTLRAFGSDDKGFSDEIADHLGLTDIQRKTTMQTIVRKDDRIKKFSAWHRLLYRAAAHAAKLELISHPSDTEKLTGRKEWMLTEKGIDYALRISGIPIKQKGVMFVKTYEVQKVKTKIEHAARVENYNPFDSTKTTMKTTRETLIRARGFRQAIIEAYDFCCSVCGLKIQSPDFIGWEVEAAHIVPHRFYGKDDIWNGIALCHLHHWAFDVGWFTLRQDFTIEVSQRIDQLSKGQGLMLENDILKGTLKSASKIKLPNRANIYPHKNAILWHRENIFFVSR